MSTPDTLLPPPPDEEQELLPPPEDEAIEALRLHLETPEPETMTVSSTQQLEVLPADFQLPAAIRWVPNPALQTRANELATQIAALAVTDDASCHRMDELLTIARAHDQAIDQHFAEPVEYFFSRHRALTKQRGEFHDVLPEMIRLGGRRIYDFTQAQERQAAEDRRRRQEDADRLAREQAQREAEEARRAQAPPSVVEQLEAHAQTVTAPPVASTTPTPRETLKGSAVTTTRKARPKGTEGAAADQQPGMALLSPAQRLAIFDAMKAVLDGRAPITTFEINYSYLDARAKSDKLTFNIPGFELYDVGGVRGKSTRVK